jgi:hypothetical protein
MMNSSKVNHFGNPLITSKVGNNNNRSITLHKTPESPASTFSKNDILKCKTPNKHSTEPAQLPRGTKTPSSLQQRHTVSPTSTFTERMTLSTSSHGDSSSLQQDAPEETIMLVGSTITTGSSIGLPSHYPGSGLHDRMNSLGSSVLLEELQDFDDIFGQGQNFSSSNHKESSHNVDNERECNPSRIQSDYYEDDDDDLRVLSHSLPFRLNIQHKRTVSELSTSSLNIPPTPGMSEQYRSNASALSTGSSISNHGSTSTKTVSTTRSHRRSRNLAMGSKEFQSAVLGELDC